MRVDRNYYGNTTNYGDYHSTVSSLFPPPVPGACPVLQVSPAVSWSVSHTHNMPYYDEMPPLSRAQYTVLYTIHCTIHKGNSLSLMSLGLPRQQAERCRSLQSEWTGWEHFLILHRPTLRGTPTDIRLTCPINFTPLYPSSQEINSCNGLL